MEDREVGEVWREHLFNTDFYEEHLAEQIIRLIRKLVEERAMRWQSEQGIAGGTAGLYKALRDFGIPPETWKE